MLDDFPDDLRPVVHKHWGKFPPQHPLVKDAFGLLFGMLFVVAFLGNSCVIYVFAGTKRLRTPVRIAKQVCLKTFKFLPLFSPTFSLSIWPSLTCACIPLKPFPSSSTLFTHPRGCTGHWGAGSTAASVAYLVNEKQVLNLRQTSYTKFPQELFPSVQCW